MERVEDASSGERSGHSTDSNAGIDPDTGIHTTGIHAAGNNYNSKALAGDYGLHCTHLAFLASALTEGTAPHRLHPFDLALVAVYLVGITLFGLRFRKRSAMGCRNPVP